MPSGQLEIEAKYIIPDATTFQALQHLAHLGDFTVAPSGAKQTVDCYVDTTDHRLMQAGYACRVRTVAHQKQLTLKALTHAEGTIHRREELNTPIDADDMAGWPDSEAKRFVQSTIQELPLLPLFTIHQMRYRFEVICQGTPVIELSLDDVIIDDTDTFFALEAEVLATGSESHLHQFITLLTAQWSLEADPHSKFERALTKLRG